MAHGCLARTGHKAKQSCQKRMHSLLAQMMFCYWLVKKTCCAVLCCAVLGWAGLGWAGLGWAGLGWAVLWPSCLIIQQTRSHVASCCHTLHFNSARIAFVQCKHQIAGLRLSRIYVGQQAMRCTLWLVQVLLVLEAWTCPACPGCSYQAHLWPTRQPMCLPMCLPGAMQDLRVLHNSKSLMPQVCTSGMTKASLHRQQWCPQL